MKTKINAIVDKAVFADGRYKGIEYFNEEVEVLKVDCKNYTAYIDAETNMYVSTLVFIKWVASEIENRIESAKDWKIMHLNSSENQLEENDYELYIKDIFARCNKCFSNNDYEEEFVRIDIFSAIYEPEFDCAEQGISDDIAYSLTKQFGYFWAENFETIFKNAE